MTAQAVVVEPTTPRTPQGALFLGFGTVLRKEAAEWTRGRRALIVGLVSIAGAALTTSISFIAGEAPPGEPSLSMDPTINVLLGWEGLTFQIVALLATVGLLTTERDRGTLAWNLSHPVSPTSVIAAKWAAGVLIYGLVGVLLPLGTSSVIATLVYGAVPNLATIGIFAGLYLAVPAFYIGLTVALGTFVKSTAAIAGIGFACMLLPSAVGALLPVVNVVSPTSISGWALATAVGQSPSALTLVGWVVSMAILAISAKVIFDRQEF